MIPFRQPSRNGARRNGLVCLAAMIAAVAMPATARNVAVAGTVLTIDGAVAASRKLSTADLAAMPRTHVTSIIHGKTLNCEGPWLTDVLASAGAPISENLRGPALLLAVVASAADGYQAAFTLGEIDHTLGNAPIIVADHCDGHALAPEDGPLRLIASGDKRGARSVRQLQRLTVAALPSLDKP